MSLGLQQVFNTMTSAMSAQSIRMNLIASNLANAGSEAKTPATTYRARHPVFQEIQNQIAGLDPADQAIGGVQVVDIIQSNGPLPYRIDPGSPLADAEGRVYTTDVNVIQEMTDMVAASREYEANVEVMNTVKSLILKSVNALKD